MFIVNIYCKGSNGSKRNYNAEADVAYIGHNLLASATPTAQAAPGKAMQRILMSSPRHNHHFKWHSHSYTFEEIHNSFQTYSSPSMTI